MKIGIMGLPNSGKTTVFSALTGESFNKSNVRDKFIIRNISVPDSRIDYLSDIYQPEKTVYPEIDLLDYNDFSADTKSLKPEYISKLRECDGLLKVIRDFDSDVYPPALGDASPAGELTEMDDEIILNDLLAVEKRLEKLENAKYKLTNDENIEMKILSKFREQLSSGDFLFRMEMNENEKRICGTFGYLSAKEEIIVINSNEPEKTSQPELIARLKEQNREFAIISAENEKDLNELEGEDREELAREMQISEFGIEKIINKFFYRLNLIMFFTVGKDEVRGWTLQQGDSALEAAGTIHSDLKRGFIKAEVVSYEDFKQYGSMKECATHGVMRQEGKEYTVKDGDIITIKFNV